MTSEEKIDFEARLAALEEAEEKRRLDAALDATAKIVGNVYGAAAVYTNGVIAAGYAVFFGIWAAAREHMLPERMMLAFLLMGFSAAVFVLFEVTKMFFVARFVQKNVQGLDQAKEQGHLAPLQQLELAHVRSQLVFSRIWLCALIASVLPAIAAIAIAGWDLIDFLLASLDRRRI